MIYFMYTSSHSFDAETNFSNKTSLPVRGMSMTAQQLPPNGLKYVKSKRYDITSCRIRSEQLHIIRHNGDAMQ